MKIHVVHVVNGSTGNHWYTCNDATRQLDISGSQITFKAGPGIDEKGRKVLAAQYREAAVIITYDED